MRQANLRKKARLAVKKHKKQEAKEKRATAKSNAGTTSRAHARKSKH